MTTKNELIKKYSNHTYLMQADCFSPSSIILGYNEINVKIVEHNEWTGDLKNTILFSNSSNLNNNKALCFHCKMNSLADKPANNEVNQLVSLNNKKT